jgi:hypothetical protein
MVSLTDLTFLVSQKVKDAEVLLRNKRNAGAIYMIGYALELSLKRKISQTLGFHNGFPENKMEFRLYAVQLRAFNGLSHTPGLTQIGQIRHHKLPDLLVYSGLQYRVTSTFLTEWQTVSGWNPEQRYVRQRITNKRAATFVSAAKQLLKEFS